MSEPAKILTIEDDPSVRASLVTFLEDSGFYLHEAANGREGIGCFLRERPDAVLCDLRLPDIDGLDVLSAITKASPETPVIIVSGAGMIGDAVQALKRGAWDFITKPIADMGVVENAITKSMERARLMRENREYQLRLECINRDLRETLRQLQADQEAGREIQTKLLPKDNRSFGDYRFHRRLFPSTVLSGDFVDYFAVDERHTGFYIADVSGHGAASAFVTVMLKTLMNQYIESSLQEDEPVILQPDQTLHRLNQDLCRQNLDKYLTILYGVLDREDDVLVWSNGGQFPYPIYVDGDQAPKVLSCPSRPVGLFEDAQYTSFRLDLDERFLLLFVSDGLLELMPQKSKRACVHDLLDRIDNPDVFIDEVIAGIGVRDRQLPDDVTLLSLTRKGSHV